MNVPDRGGVKRASNDVARRDRRAPTRVPTPRKARDAVVVALELDAVPVHRRRLCELVDDRDAHRLAALEDDGAGRYGGALGTAGVRALLEDVAESAGSLRVPPSSTRATRRSSRRARGSARRPRAGASHRDPHHRAGHHLERMVLDVAMRAACRRRGSRRARRRTRGARCRGSGTASCRGASVSRSSANVLPLAMRSVTTRRAGAPAGSRVSRPLVAAAVHVEVEPVQVHRVHGDPGVDQAACGRRRRPDTSAVRCAATTGRS